MHAYIQYAYLLSCFVVSISQFLYSRIDPTETYKTLMEKKPEEEVPKILKSLGYPFTIHKRSLASVGSPHTWPILLGALHWLMELVKVCD